jgi:phosphate transport system permease protein
MQTNVESEDRKSRKEGSNLRRRQIVDKIASAAILAAVVLAIVPLALILADIVIKAAPVMSLGFLTNLPKGSPFAPNQGISNAIIGSFVMVGFASLIAIPIGVGAGIFLSEWAEMKFAWVASFMNDVLAEFPSIVIGIFIFVIIVLATRSFSGYAGGTALAIIMIPIVARTTEESLKLVPNSYREASMALGVSRWRTITRIVLSTGRGGVITGVLLAVARVIGETAPLLLTALGSTLAFQTLSQPTESLSLLIYFYGTSAYKSWQAEAWGAALVLVIIVLALNISVRALTRGRFITGVD